MKIKILTFDQLDSTNTEAASHARLGAEEGLCVMARQQMAGRGRHGRTWVSEKDAGMYFSIVLRPRLDAKFLPLVTLMAGIAVHDALSEFGLKPDIKWVNDILIAEKKICGILAETVETLKGQAVVVGIGINLTSSNFPPEIAASATSIESEQGNTIEPGKLTAELTHNLSHFYGVLNDVDGHRKIVQEWQKRSTYYKGKQVRVMLDRKVFEGVTDGLEENGALRVQTSDGSIKIVQAGDVERVRAAQTK